MSLANSIKSSNFLHLAITFESCIEITSLSGLTKLRENKITCHETKGLNKKENQVFTDCIPQHTSSKKCLLHPLCFNSTQRKLWCSGSHSGCWQCPRHTDQQEQQASLQIWGSSMKTNVSSLWTEEQQSPMSLYQHTSSRSDIHTWKPKQETQTLLITIQAIMLHLSSSSVKQWFCRFSVQTVRIYLGTTANTWTKISREGPPESKKWGQN